MFEHRAHILECFALAAAGLLHRFICVFFLVAFRLRLYAWVLPFCMVKWFVLSHFQLMRCLLRENLCTALYF